MCKGHLLGCAYVPPKKKNTILMLKKGIGKKRHIFSNFLFAKESMWISVMNS